MMSKFGFVFSFGLAVTPKLHLQQRDCSQNVWYGIEACLDPSFMSILQAFQGEGGYHEEGGEVNSRFLCPNIEWKVAWINLYFHRSKIIWRPWTDRENCRSKRSNWSLICRRCQTDLKPSCDGVTSKRRQLIRLAAAKACTVYTVYTVCTVYGSCDYPYMQKNHICTMRQ